MARCTHQDYEIIINYGVPPLNKSQVLRKDNAPDAFQEFLLKAAIEEIKRGSAPEPQGGTE